MIRFLLLIAALAIGCVTALVLELRISHVRQSGLIDLPEWSKAIAPDSGMRQGRLVAAARVADGSALDLIWQGERIGADGVHYRLTANGAHNLEAAGNGILNWQLGHVDVHDGLLNLDINALRPSGVLAGVQGRLLMSDLAVNLSRAPFAIETLTGEGNIEGLSVDGVALGRLHLTVRDAGGQGWQTDITLESDVTKISGIMTGSYTDVITQYDLAIMDKPALPEHLRQRFDRTMTRTNDGWRLSGALNISQLIRIPG